MAIRSVNPPDDDWLTGIALGEPRLIPEWPDGRALALVVATVPPGTRGPVRLHAVTTAAEADRLISESKDHQLWYVVARYDLFKDDVVPGLQPGDFRDDPVDRPPDPPGDPPGGAGPPGAAPDS